MDYKIYTSDDFLTTQWSGGETTELFIYPNGADFKSREFDFRLSIATINIEESDFTPLPDIDRTLLLLEGELELIHKGHHSCKLAPLMQDSFKGDWQTKCIGTGKDFNLMTKGCKGTLTIFSDGESAINSNKISGIYCIDGVTYINGEIVNSNELVIFEDGSEMTFSTNGTVIIIKVN